jgi:hypothetical protein
MRQAHDDSPNKSVISSISPLSQSSKRILNMNEDEDKTNAFLLADAGTVLLDNIRKRKRCFDVDALLAPDDHRFKQVQSKSQVTTTSRNDLPIKQDQAKENPNSNMHAHLFLNELQCTTIHTSQQQANIRIESNRIGPKNAHNHDGLTRFCNNPENLQQLTNLSKTESDNIDIEKWKQTFSKIMARSYKNNYYSLNSNANDLHVMPRTISDVKLQNQKKIGARNVNKEEPT